VPFPSTLKRVFPIFFCWAFLASKKAHYVLLHLHLQTKRELTLLFIDFPFVGLSLVCWSYLVFIFSICRYLFTHDHVLQGTVQVPWPFSFFFFSCKRIIKDKTWALTGGGALEQPNNQAGFNPRIQGLLRSHKDKRAVCSQTYWTLHVLAKTLSF
jgi:hypothetical protein